MNKEIGMRIKEARNDINMSADALAEEIGVDKSTIHRYENGSIENIKLPVISAIAQILGVNSAWLIGKSDDKYLPAKLYSTENVQTGQVIGEIAAGKPILAYQYEGEFVEVPGLKKKWDFMLQVRGDSMIGAGIHNGDIAFIRSQQDVDNGQIAAVLIDDETTLKRVYKYDGFIVLQAENKKYSPIVIHRSDGKVIRIMGLAVYVLSEVR